jgi:probable F420-dependent oxidoreductase
VTDGHPGSLSQLGCYVLPGGVSDSRPAIDQARAAEALGLGAVWIGERYDTKDLPSLAGAITQVTDTVRIGAAITHTGLRHPMVLASMGQTLQSLSNGRFRLGLGRSASWRWQAYGIAPPTIASMCDTAEILRRLWAGETVSYDGPAGSFPSLWLPQRPDGEPPPLLLAAVGPKTIDAAGRSFDGVILHPFLTVDAVREARRRFVRAAEDSGRDPAALRCVATVAVAPDTTEEEAKLAIESRAAGYLSVVGLGDAIARANGWNEEDLARYRSQTTLVGLNGLTADKHLSRRQLIDLCDQIPSDWIASSSAAGTAAFVASRLEEYLAAGADEIIIHGTSGAGLAPLAAVMGAAGSP